MDIKSEPIEYETIILRDLDVSYPSGIKSITLDPEDIFELVLDTGDLIVKEVAEDATTVYLGRNMECYRLKNRSHRRQIEKPRT